MINLGYGNSTRRSVIYQTWCHSCKSRGKKDNNDDEKEMYNDEDGSKNEYENDKKRKAEEKDESSNNFIYIGETSRSAKERASEHFKDKEYLRMRSHMLKHAVQNHSEVHPSEVEFRIKILSYHKTAFDRQISEAVLIRRNLGPNLLHSKQEYNRCYIPRITVKQNKKEAIDTHIVNENDAINKMKDMLSIWKKRSNKKLEDNYAIESKTKRRKIQTEVETNVRKFEDQNQPEEPLKEFTPPCVRV